MKRLLGIGCALVALALALGPAAPSAQAQLIADKVDPALRDLMQADPLAPLPVIVEMQQPLPRSSARRTSIARSRPSTLLRFYGVPVAALSLVDSAAGFANAAGIEALNLAPTVAFIHHDATVGPRPSAAPPAPAAPDQVSSVYPQVVKANKVWEQGIAGGA